MVHGKAAHSASYKSKNAILIAADSIKSLKMKVEKHKHPTLGRTTINLAYLLGGTLVNSSIEKRLNLVPDRAQVTLEIRPSYPKMRAKMT